MTELVGTTALVTGASQGIGRACVQALLDLGAKTVYAVDVVEQEPVPGATSVVLDVSEERAVAAFLGSVGPVGVLVNNAGVYSSRNGLNIATDDWRRTFEVNVLGVFLMTRAVTTDLIAHHLPGAVVNIASVAGRRAFPNQADYCASKAAVIGFTRAAALDLAAAGITVNAVAPGTIDTPMMDRVVADLTRETGLNDSDQRAAMTREIPIGRMQQPREVAAMAAFLATTDARAITGEVINVDGGLTRN